MKLLIYVKADVCVGGCGCVCVCGWTRKNLYLYKYSGDFYEEVDVDVCVKNVSLYVYYSDFYC